MRFIETPIFTRLVEGLLDDEKYRSLQSELLLRPNAGRVIPGSGGLRKIHWSSKGKGKSGGRRVIYRWEEAGETFFMLYVYAKNDQEDLRARYEIT